jgi:ADP-heptose:LPS heptosyltransferase
MDKFTRNPPALAVGRFKSVVLIRQRPSIGDALLLAPLIDQLKQKFPDHALTVITDAQYLGGALPIIFRGIPGVDRVECIDSHEWTTPDNQQVDFTLRGAATDPLPHTVKNADMIVNCNSAFIHYERAYKGNPAMGIAEFWLFHHGLLGSLANLLPDYTVSLGASRAVELWLDEQNPQRKPMVGIVLRAGDPARDWDFDNKSGTVAAWLHTKGYLPVGIDYARPLNSPYGISYVGRPIDRVAALIERCTAVLTPDTGLLHLAQAVGTPQIALWGIMRPELRVAGYKCTVVPKNSLGYCADTDSGCQCHWKFQRWSCLHRITTTMIIDGLQEVLR